MTNNSETLLPNRKNLSAFRKEQIVKSASRLFLKQSYDRTSIRDIVRECKMAMGTLYYHIGTKENLLRMVVEYHDLKHKEILAKVETSLNTGDPRNAHLTAIEAFSAGIDEIKETFVFVFTETKVMPRDAREIILDTERSIIAAFQRILLEGQKKGIFRIKNPTLAAHHIVSMVEMWSVKWWYLKSFCTWDEFNEALTDFVLRSVSEGTS
jgi:AcrR family transcriptional regulator